MKYYLMVGLVFASFGLNCTDLSTIERAPFVCEEGNDAGVRSIYIGPKSAPGSRLHSADYPVAVWLTDDCCLRLPDYIASRFIKTSREEPLVLRMRGLFDDCSHDLAAKKRIESYWLGFMAKLLVLQLPAFGSATVCLTGDEVRIFKHYGLTLPSPAMLEAFALALFSLTGQSEVFRSVERLNPVSVMKLYCRRLDVAIVQECNAISRKEGDAVLALAHVEAHPELFAFYPLAVSRRLGLVLSEGSLEERTTAFQLLVKLVEAQSVNNLECSIEGLNAIVGWVSSHDYAPISYFPSSESSVSISSSYLDRESVPSVSALPVRTSKSLPHELAHAYYDRLNVLSVFFNLDVSGKKRLWARVFRSLIRHYAASGEAIKQAALEEFVLAYQLPEVAAEVAVGKKPWCC